MLKPSILAIRVALVLATTSAQAHSSPQEDLVALPLDQLLGMEVSGASKFSTIRAHTPAAVTVITGEEIRALGLRTLPDVLATIKGVMMTNDRTYGYIGVRGFYAPGDYNTRVLMLINGNRVNDALFDQAYLGSEFPLDLENVEKIEYIPGQGSAVYGANALFAVINVVTHHPREAAAFEASSSVGSFGARSASMSGMTQFGTKGVVRWSASEVRQHGEDIASKGAVVNDGDRLRRTNLMVDARWGDLSFTAIHSSREKGMPVMLSSVPGNNRAVSYDNTSLLNLSWEHITEKGDTALVRVFANSYSYLGRYLLEGDVPAYNEDISRARWWGAEARWTTARLKNHKIMVGAEMQMTPVLEMLNADLEPTFVEYLDIRNKSHRAAVFAEDQVTLSPTWTLDAGVRLDHLKGFEKQVSSRVALMWRPQDNLATKLIYGTAYRPPNDFEAKYEVPGTGSFRANQSLGQETVRGIEWNIEWSPSASDSLNFSVFRNKASALIAQEYLSEIETYQFQNLGAVTARGIEIEWQHGWNNGARLRTNLSHTQARDHEAAVQVATYAPRYLANAMLTMPVTKGVTAGIWWHAESQRGAARGFSRADVSLSSPLRPNSWNWSLRASNLFDRAYTAPGTDIEALPTIAQPRRSLELRIGREF